MKRKLFCIVLSFAMVIAMMPAMTATAFADDITSEDIMDAIKKIMSDETKSDVEQFLDMMQTAGETVDTMIDVAKKVDAELDEFGKVLDANFHTVTIKAGENGKVNQYLPKTVAKDTTITASGNRLRIGLLDTVTATASKNYEFDSWVGLPVNGKVTSDITITATFKAKSYTVKFDVNNMGIAPVDQTITHGGKVMSPVEPTVPGYDFGGWYKDKQYKTAWDFNTDTVTKATTLYAKWTEAEVQTAVEAEVEEEKFEYEIDQFEIRCNTEKVKKGIKVVAKVTLGDLDAIKKSGHTVTYKFYRSTGPNDEYEYMFTSKTGKYTNTSVKKGKRYYYRAMAIITDENGDEVLRTLLKDCKYGSRKI